MGRPIWAVSRRGEMGECVILLPGPFFYTLTGCIVLRRHEECSRGFLTDAVSAAAFCSPSERLCGHRRKEYPQIPKSIHTRVKTNGDAAGKYSRAVVNSDDLLCEFRYLAEHVKYTVEMIMKESDLSKLIIYSSRQLQASLIYTQVCITPGPYVTKIIRAY